MKDSKIILIFAAVLLLLGAAYAYTSEGIVSAEVREDTVLPEEYAPRFSAQTGFYDEPFFLTISCPVRGAEIYYTMDGSVPSEESAHYEAPIPLTDRTPQPNVLSALAGVCPDGDFLPSEPVLKGNVIRAMAVLPDGSRSRVTNGTYFIGTDREESVGSLPVISMYADPQDLFSHERGIYVLGKIYEDHIMSEGAPGTDGSDEEGLYGNCFMRGREWERPAAMDYIPVNPEEKGFSTDIGVRIMGGSSRAYMQKSFRLKCRSEYGDKNIYYDLFGDGHTKHKSFLLRNGGNDCDYARFRDPMLQELVSDRDIETQASVPAVLFIDGEYWGLYAMTEDYDGHYIENRGYGVKAENVVMIKNGTVEEGTDADITLFNDMVDYITGNDMSDESCYDTACSMLDMQSFADYCAFNIYIDNKDSFFTNDNNWLMWRARVPDQNKEKGDGRWRMMVYDTDYSTGIYENGEDYGGDTLGDVLEGSPDATGSRLLRALVKNDRFAKLFSDSLYDMRNSCFERERVKEAVSRYLSEYEKPMYDTYERFGPEARLWSDPAEYYNMRVGELAGWLDGRYETFAGRIVDYENMW